MSEINKKKSSVADYKWIRGLDVLHRSDYFVTRVILQTDGDSLFFNYVAVDKNGKVLEESIDGYPITLEELRKKFERVKEESRADVSNT